MDLSSLEKLCDKLEGERDSAYELAQSTERTVYVEEKTNASWSWGLGSFAGVAAGFKLFSYFMDAYSNGTLNPVLSTAQNIFPFTLPIATVAGGCAAMVAVSAGMQIALRNTYENAKKEFYKKDDRRYAPLSSFLHSTSGMSPGICFPERILRHSCIYLSS